MEHTRFYDGWKRCEELRRTVGWAELKLFLGAGLELAIFALIAFIGYMAVAMVCAYLFDLDAEAAMAFLVYLFIPLLTVTIAFLILRIAVQRCLLIQLRGTAHAYATVESTLWRTLPFIALVWGLHGRGIQMLFYTHHLQFLSSELLTSALKVPSYVLTAQALWNPTWKIWDIIRATYVNIVTYRAAYLGALTRYLLLTWMAVLPLVISSYTYLFVYGAQPLQSLMQKIIAITLLIVWLVFIALPYVIAPFIACMIYCLERGTATSGIAQRS